MVTDKEALAAAKTVKQYCVERDKNCESCVFDDVAPMDSARNMCCGNALPDNWEFDEDETNMR